MLRDLNISDLGRMEQVLPPVVARRARHVVTEDARVLAAVEGMRSNDLVRLGRLMYESHASLRDDYEVSCPELDTLVEIARRQSGCLGARLTGAGFGGCTANLVQNEAIPAFVASVGREYKAKTGLDAPIYVCRAAAGANVISLPKQA
jgi:galactokinase